MVACCSKKMLEVNKIGLTSQLMFGSDGNLLHPWYEVISLSGIGMRRIVFWYNSSALHTEEAPNHSNFSEGLYGVIWPSQTTQTLCGWVFASNGWHLKIEVPLGISYHEFVSRIEGNEMFGGYCIDLFIAALNLLLYPFYTSLLHLVIVQPTH